MAWAEDYRQEWIAETLRVFGFLNRKHIQRKFGISPPQASLDIQRFLRERPGLMEYDKSAKLYNGQVMSYAVTKAMGRFTKRLEEMNAAQKDLNVLGNASEERP